MRKIVLWILGLLLALVLAVYILIRIPAVQDFARRKAVAYLEKTLGTPVKVDRLSITFPKNIVLEGVYFEDQHGDTLFAGQQLLANIHLYKLLRNTVEIGRLEFHGITANVHQAIDSSYNFDYILDAFSSDQPSPASDSKPMAISLDNVLLDNVVLHYTNAPDSTDASIDIGRLDIDVDDLDLASQSYHITSIALQNTTGSFVQYKPLTNRESTAQDIAERDEPFGIDLQFGTAALESVKFHYANAISDIEADVDFGKVNITSDALNLDQRVISLENISMENSSVTLAMGMEKQVEVVKEEAKKEIALESEVWKIAVGAVHLKNNSMAYDDFSSPPAQEGIDYAHLHLKDLSLEADDIAYSDSVMHALVNSATLTDQSGFVINAFRGNIELGEHSGFARDLHLETEGSLIDGSMEFQYPSLDSVAARPESLYQKSVFHESTLSLKDLYAVAPELKDIEPFRNITSDRIYLDAEIEGYLNDLRFGYVSFSGLSATKAQLSGKITGLPDPEKLYYDLQIDNLNTNSRDIIAILPPGTLPDSIRLPEHVSAKGTIRGSSHIFTADLDLKTSLGSGHMDGTIHLDDPMSLDGEFVLNDFQAGYMFMQDSILGNVTFRANGNLKGIGTDSLSGNFKGSVDKIGLLDYEYQNIAFDLTADHGRIKALLEAKDPNLQFTMDANAVMVDSSLGETHFTIDLARADLHALHFADAPIAFHGIATGDFTSLDRKAINGTLAFQGLTFSDSARTVRIDTLSITSSAGEGKDKLIVETDFLTLEMTGDYQLTEVFPALNRSISGYFGTNDNSTASIQPQRFELEGELRYSPLFTQIDTNIGRFEPVQLKGTYNSENDQLTFSGVTEQFQYKPARIQELSFDVDTRGDVLHYTAGWEALHSDAVSLHKTALEGDIDDGKISSAFSIRDSADREQFRVNATMVPEGTGYVVSLDPKGLLLNYEDWTVAPDNEIRYDTNALAVQNFVLSNGTQRLSAHSEPPGVNHPIAIEFDNFNIETIAHIISSDSLYAGGIINGKAMLRDYFTSPVFTADLSVKDLSYLGDTLGDLKLNVDNETSNTLSAKASISGGGNSANLEGRYIISSETLDLKAHIETLRLASVEGFSLGTFSDAHGSVHGDLNISGQVLKPVVEGDLHFDSASVHVTQLNARYALANEGVRFTNSDIHFNNFTITDEEQNELHFNGIIYTETFSNFTFALDIDSDNFKVLNTQAHDNELYYGTLYLDSRIRVRGALNKPEINADLEILDKTKMTIIIPQTDPGIVEREGVVSFVDLDHPGLDSLIALALDSLNTSSIQGLIAFANIKVTDASEFTLVIDQGSGDFLRLRGNAELNASLDPSGKVSLTGNYVLKEGIYELSFNFIKRRFDIRNGSTITWNGEPTSGEIDITAAYVVEAAPIDLVEKQIAGATQAETNYYKEKLPFELLLTLTGTLIKPEVSFDIELPEGNYPVSPEVITTVQAKLQQLSREESEVNKQAFALVILNRFISDDPFRSAAGGTSAESYARQSVSKLLSQQLNNLTANLISGVDLNFDLESTEDYSTGQLQNRTDLNVSASKRLLDDRITVTVGSNFELEGTEQPSEKTNNIAGDISVEYQLSKDGRYLLRAYRKDEYQVAVEGHVIKTGLSFVIQLDYDRFMEIFKKSKTGNK